MPIDKAARRVWRKEIRDILNRDWDPIGGCPEDEYDSYGAAIAAMIKDDVTDTQLLDYLAWAEVEHMDLGRPFNLGRAKKVITAIRALSVPD